MKQLQGQVAVLTGAAGGICSELATQLAKEGCHLALADIDKDSVEALAKQLNTEGLRVSSHVVDVRVPAELDRLAEEVRAAHGGASLLVCGAGVTVLGPFSSHNSDDLDWLLDLNVKGLMHTCRAFLPLLMQADQAHIVNISSMTALFWVPTQALYSASKFAVRGFSHALRVELGVKNIGVTAVLPGAVATDFMRNARSYDTMASQKLPEYIDRFGLRPKRLARRILSAIAGNKAEIIVGTDAKFVLWAQRLLPGLIGFLLGFSYRRYTPGGTYDGQG